MSSLQAVGNDNGTPGATTITVTLPTITAGSCINAFVGIYAKDVTSVDDLAPKDFGGHDRPAHVGAWFMAKWRDRALDSGVQVAARQMRKQGVPLEVARFVLASAAPVSTGKEQAGI